MTPASVATEQLKNKAWNSQFTGKVLVQFSSAMTGLSAMEATKRLAVDGPNELKERKCSGALQIFL